VAERFLQSRFTTAKWPRFNSRSRPVVASLDKALTKIFSA